MPPEDDERAKGEGEPDAEEDAGAAEPAGESAEDAEASEAAPLTGSAGREDIEKQREAAASGTSRTPLLVAVVLILAVLAVAAYFYFASTSASAGSAIAKSTVSTDSGTQKLATGSSTTEKNGTKDGNYYYTYEQYYTYDDSDGSATSGTDGATAGAATTELVNAAQFSRFFTDNGYPAPAAQHYTTFAKSVTYGGFTTPREVGMFMANLIHESGGLVYTKEIGCPGDAKCSNYNTATWDSSTCGVSKTDPCPKTAAAGKQYYVSRHLRHCKTRIGARVPAAELAIELCVCLLGDFRR